MTILDNPLDPGPEPTARDLLAAANAQTAAALSLQASVEKLAKSTRRNWYLVVLDISLSVGFVVVGFFAVHGSSSADQATAIASANQEALNATCISSNQVRSKESILWDQTLAIFRAGAADSAQGLSEINQIQNLANKTFHLRDCAAVNSTNKANSGK
jgi:hypothetical protein